VYDKVGNFGRSMGIYEVFALAGKWRCSEMYAMFSLVTLQDKFRRKENGSESICLTMIYQT